ncbi:MAG: flagellar biosynthesis anti-sigma factor FlgM [Acidobacteriaceae bacterium]|nr:flagellar biosynthesis anti-sigma factor FlgM [Acidobacteriaceae bacterium]MBV9779070.1 flagellar biosynthesis anti-sigma factor FlgM [Acidobacteriaceae bacterium]
MSTKGQRVPAKLVDIQSRKIRIAELRRQYREGLYRVNEEKLSAKIIESHLRR